ncbi:hypothetical protein QTP70_012852 [Hemibagrus guttatus]|uniref:Monocarboxylate transporter 3 n=1 Tax=Hemibagrus guttatus TaxID=175788 RepID=A0AAE0QQY0_9TELE|nr:hypothetical protein QTP70_012852 [Hemibagrus guttatus]
MGSSVVERNRVDPPDGGWGWVVLFGGFIITGFSYAFPKAISVYFKELMRDFGCGYSDTAWISSIMLAMLYGSGLGLALNFQPSLIMLGSYFDKRRPLANGLAATGSPVFLSALSPLGQVLLDCFGWRGGFLIMGGLLLNCCTCGAVMRPLGYKVRKSAARDESNAHELKEMLPSKTGQEENDLEKAQKEKPKRKKLLDFSVLRDKGLIIYIAAKFVVVLGLFVPTILLVNYAKDQGIPDKEAAFLLSIIGFIDIFARPTCGLVAGLKCIRAKMPYFFSLALLLNGLTDICSARSTDYMGLVIFCVFFGLSYGMVGALQFEVLMGIVGTNSFPSALGLVLLIEATAVLIGPPSAGLLVDTYKNYELIFYMAGGELMAAGLFLAIVSYCCSEVQKKKDTSAVQDTDTEGNSNHTNHEDTHAMDNS